MFIYTCLPSANNCRVAADVGMVKKTAVIPLNAAIILRASEQKGRHSFKTISWEFHLITCTYYVVCLGAFSSHPQKENCANQEPTEG